ncbi:NUDIX hydrolase [Sphingomonas sp. LY29]|uniref:NUDIX hydrolase n=1 Tax=Sphingomonas sp. LY29 TaxID=3095341 RepID=UPI002D7984B9|nr:NUDIX hydrolase [Sphingomonas sp. LY29]WRP25552.1 NUDIX hydrolase [Sphingomonas sp. LY29]WRP25562.1 NUDIX hydrolase [Sphingomonas sp. LY29]
MHDDAIPAATLIVWRDPTPTFADPRILVVERSSRMAFAAGATVFPGGRVDNADRRFAAELGSPDEAAKITAIRETVEESAVLVAADAAPEAGPELQRRLLAGDDFADAIATMGLRLDLDLLVPFARWMPAFKQPRKFDTIFYLAPSPKGDWPTTPQPGECVAAEWASPEDILKRIERGDAHAIFPTKRNLERLARHRLLTAAIEDAKDHSLDTIIPWVEDIDGVPHVRIPGDRGYPILFEPLTTAFRA